MRKSLLPNADGGTEAGLDTAEEHLTRLSAARMEDFPGTDPTLFPPLRTHLISSIRTHPISRVRINWHLWDVAHRRGRHDGESGAPLRIPSPSSRSGDRRRAAPRWGWAGL